MELSPLSRTLGLPSSQPSQGLVTAPREVSPDHQGQEAARTAPAPEDLQAQTAGVERGPLHAPTPLDMPPRRLHRLVSYLELRAARLLFR
jgi:hypothetical protein